MAGTTARRRSLISGGTDKGTVLVGQDSPGKSKKQKRRKRSMVKKTAVEQTTCMISAGQTLSGRYLIQKELARGAMGIVFEALDKELEDTTVAIKVLSPELTDDEKAREQLRHEAMAAMALTHTNIVRLHGFERDNKTVYLVMELIDGPTVEEILVDEEVLSYSSVVEIVQALCPALDYAHERSVIHRDIKPSNLMLAIEAGKSLYKLTDFGIASRAAKVAEAAGTLLYISPEQLRNQEIDGRADQYALAATVYELLAGVPPIEGPALSHRILKETPQPLTDIPPWANEALMRALEKKPEDRFPTCTEFMHAFCEEPAAFVIPEDCLPGTAEHHKAGYWNIIGYRIKRIFFSGVLDVAAPLFVTAMLSAGLVAGLAKVLPEQLLFSVMVFLPSLVFFYLLFKDVDGGRFSVYKKICNMRVVTRDLQPCPQWRLILRNLFPLLPAIGLVFAKGEVANTVGTAVTTGMILEVALLTYISQTRRFGDLIAGTRVVYEGALEPNIREKVNTHGNLWIALVLVALSLSSFVSVITYFIR